VEGSKTVLSSARKKKNSRSAVGLKNERNAARLGSKKGHKVIRASPSMGVGKNALQLRIGPENQAKRTPRKKPEQKSNQKKATADCKTGPSNGGIGKNQKTRLKERKQHPPNNKQTEKTISRAGKNGSRKSVRPLVTAIEGRFEKGYAQ